MTPCANCGRETCPTLPACLRALLASSATTSSRLDCERAKSAALESKIAALRSAIPAIVTAAIDNPRFDYAALEIARDAFANPRAPCQWRAVRVVRLIRAAIGDDNG